LVSESVPAESDQAEVAELEPAVELDQAVAAEWESAVVLALELAVVLAAESVAVQESAAVQDQAEESAAEPAASSPCLHCYRNPSRAAMRWQGQTRLEILRTTTYSRLYLSCLWYKSAW